MAAARPSPARLSLVYLAVGAVGVVAYRLFQSSVFETVVIEALGAGAVVAILLGVRLHRPASRLPWYLLALAFGLWGVIAFGLWQASIIDNGMPPAAFSLADAFFYAGEIAFVAVLALLLKRREVGGSSLIEGAVITVALAAVAWMFLISAYAQRAGLPLGLRVGQSGYALLDVLVFALAARVVVTPGARRPALLLLLAAAGGLLGADLIWNWLTLGTSYVPGSYYDTGWLLFMLFGGAAALHPSMRTLFDREPRRVSRGVQHRALLVGALLTAPALLVINALGKPERGTIVVVAVAASAISLLVVARMTTSLREQKRLSVRLSDQNERLLDLDRLKDDFVASVSHELRTPLTSIRGYLELVLDGGAGALNAEQERFLAVVDRNSDRLLRVVGDLLFVGQVDAGKLALERELLDLAELAMKGVEAARPQADFKGIELVLDAEECGPLSGDHSRLAQLLDNLVSNALKFTPAGGRVEVRVGAEGEQALLEVTDTGPGVSPVERERLFERFYRTAGATKAAIPGTGLGLSIAKAIAEAHGGSIAVESEPGRGTTFRVELPLLGSPEEGATLPPARQAVVL